MSKCIVYRCLERSERFKKLLAIRLSCQTDRETQTDREREGEGERVSEREFYHLGQWKGFVVLWLLFCFCFPLLD